MTVDTSSYTDKDWAHASEAFDVVQDLISGKDLTSSNEAQTRYDVINTLIQDVFGWKAGQVAVEEPMESKEGYIDYILSVGDRKIIIEAKRFGATFPTPTTKSRLKLKGSILGKGEIAKAINQAEAYAYDKDADLICVTNGSCWCFFITEGRDENSYATILFPFSHTGHAEELYNILAEKSVHDGSIDRISNTEPIFENRLISTINSADTRIERNNIADYILPALNHALYASALLSNLDALEKCYITTDGRAKFDTLLGIHLADARPMISEPARRIRRNQKNGPLEDLVKRDIDTAPPVTLIMGPVGAGKSTYLKHFELVSGKDVLNKQKARWIYIDFEEMGQSGNPRLFLYTKLRDYLLDESSKIDYDNVIRPAYENVIQGLLRGPLAPIANNKDEVNKRIADRIEVEYEAIEPYVDRIMSYLTKEKLCVIVMDNVDLYSDENLETRVFSEGLALSKRLLCNVIVSLRDTTYVNHRNSSVFNAYELRKLWIDPPPFKQVLSTRLTYSRKILTKKSAMIPMDNGMKLEVDDLGKFFDIVQKSLLQGAAGNYIENVADRDIRYGLGLVINFLTSGHVQADKALKKYIIEDDSNYYFPFHEVFKGTALGHWRYFKESRSENIINVFDSRTSAKKTRLLRLAVITYLADKAAQESTMNVSVEEIANLFASAGASQSDVTDTLSSLQDSRLVKTSSSKKISMSEEVHITRSGGYYLKDLSSSFVYAEQCMLDTAIEDQDTWSQLTRLTDVIESNRLSLVDRMKLRNERIKVFTDYLVDLENYMLKDKKETLQLAVMDKIAARINNEADRALASTLRYLS